jgi:hypothetical protein
MRSFPNVLPDVVENAAPVNESRSDSQAVQPDWAAHHHPADIPWMAQMTGATLQSRARASSCMATAKRLSALSRRGHPKLLARKQPATTRVAVEGAAQQLPSCSERAAVYVAPRATPSPYEKQW